ncbi:MAG: thioredoxin family protein [Thermoplasmata archaeon]
MRIEVLGTGCVKCKRIAENVKKAIAEMKINAEVVEVKDIAKIMEYGVMMTPALVIDGNVVSEGRVLSPEEIKELLGGKIIG